MELCNIRHEMPGVVGHAFISVLVAFLAVGACSDRTTTGLENASEFRQLPPAETGDGLGKALAGRRSIRSYTEDRLTDEQIGQLLWAAQGVTAESGGRTAPSAGGTYPLEVFVVEETGVFHYLPGDHLLARSRSGDIRADLAAAAFGQEAVASAPVVFVIAAEYARTERRYGDRAQRYVHLEAGHAAQNVLLQAVQLDLAAVPIGSFNDSEVQKQLELPNTWEPLYLIPVGKGVD